MISGLILAAGLSSRMGRAKQLLPLRGRILVQHVVDVASAAELDEIVVVLGHSAPEVQGALRLPPSGRVVVNPEFASGQASSLRVGLGSLDPRARAAVVLLGDQPELPPEVIRKTVESYRRTGGLVVRAVYGGTPGHPVVLDRGVWDEVVRAGEDEGARSAIASHPEWVSAVRFELSPPSEVNTPEDYRGLRDGAPGDRGG